MKRIRISCLKALSELFYYANLLFQYTRSVFNARFLNVTRCSLKQLDSNKYKVTVTFPDRTVMIQFKRPRGPTNFTSTTKPEIHPYLQNDRKTPIKIILPPAVAPPSDHCKTANDYEEEAWKNYEKNCLLINE